VKRGLPDFIILANRPGFYGSALGIELKSDKGRLSPEQREVCAAWDRMGLGIHVARSLEDVQEILETCGVPMRRRMNLFAKGASHEPAVRPQTPRHKRPPRRRRPAGALPVVLRDP
jgi:hypothetical protein